ncbi:hypothetical protein [Phocaeicola faecicola]|uniref:hypothetical protein n=1 Tax=Phocaeicola faecicola TaxID=2739389 RepID=UPI002A802A48|nr:hypothetical protein [Phocaeicola faecicola]MCI5743351.1 hypothetical protein [Bacteroides sp.]MDD6908330.1 hypothetical protein [Bacteroidaceae bacterium]MDY4871828.1 hypothetical protein [Phocaeicola faecicola]
MNFTLKRTIIVLIAFLPLMLVACKDREEIPAPPGYAEKDLQLEERLQNYLSQTYPCEITSVEVTATQVLVRGNAAEEHENLYLGEIPPYMDVVNATGFLTTQPVGKGNFEISMERFTETEGMKYDRLLSKWVLFKKGTESNEIVSAARHPDSIYASRQLSPIKLHSKKRHRRFVLQSVRVRHRRPQHQQRYGQRSSRSFFSPAAAERGCSL